MFFASLTPGRRENPLVGSLSLSPSPLLSYTEPFLGYAIISFEWLFSLPPLHCCTPSHSTLGDLGFVDSELSACPGAIAAEYSPSSLLETDFWAGMPGRGAVCHSPGRGVGHITCLLGWGEVRLQFPFYPSPRLSSRLLLVGKERGDVIKWRSVLKSPEFKYKI